MQQAGRTREDAAGSISIHFIYFILYNLFRN